MKLVFVIICVVSSLVMGLDIDEDDVPRFRNDFGFTRVVGGQDAEPGLAPYQISLRYKRYNFHMCGGSIINDTWILTAAHCCTSFRPEELQIVAGSLSLTKGGYRYDVEKVIPHENYNPTWIRNDIALLKLKKSIKYNKNVQPIELQEDYIKGDERMLLTGWGMTSYPGRVSRVLKKIHVKSLSNRDCAYIHFVEATEPLSFYKNICTFTMEGEGACKGDSGGPLVSEKDGKVSGIVSWGIPCARGRPDVYTRVSSFIPWIQEQMADAVIDEKQ